MKNVFIVNKSSRTGKAEQVWNEIERYLNDIEFTYEVNFTTGAGDATQYAKDATSLGEEVTLFVLGGDGTINEVLNGIEDFDNTYFVCLPSGSANDFARGIKLSGNALDVLKRVVDNEVEYISVDLGQVSSNGKSRIFGVSTGIGVDAFVCLQALDSKLKKILNKIKLGSATYGLLTVGDIFTMPLSNATIVADGKEIKVGNAIFIASMNGPYEGGGIPMVPYATPTSGKLSAVIAHDISRLKCFGVMLFLVAGKHQGIKGIDFVDFSEMTIKMDNAMCVHADGEHVGFEQEVRVNCLPKILKIRGL